MIIPRLSVNVPKILKRNFGIVAPLMQNASDPIQQLFIDKIREYKSKSTGGKLLDPSPEIERERQAELEKAAKQFNVSSHADPTQFPSFRFEDPKVVIDTIKSEDQ